MASLRLEQTKQALTVFIRGIENWRWDQMENGLWAPFFRLKQPEDRIEIRAPQAGSENTPVDRANWEQRIRTELRVRHYAIRNEQTYVQWSRQFLDYHKNVSSPDLEAIHVRRFLEHLAVGRNVTAATQNQALSALLFLFQNVLGRKMGDLGDTLRAKRGRKLPVVLSREEVRRLLAAAEGTPGLILRLMAP